MKNRILNSLLTVFSLTFLFLGVDCKDDPPVIPPVTPPDTTSHDFTWTTYTFGGNAGSSYFKDVAIIKDGDIWAVGQIYTSPETTYNAAHWDGKEWKLNRMLDANNRFMGDLRGIFIFGNNAIWIADGGIHRWDGVSQQAMETYDRITLIGGEENGQSIDKLWGSNANNIFGVGQKGMVAHYNGTNWTKQESRTTIDLRDVWGTSDGKTVWACGYSNDNFYSILLKHENNQWETVWQRDGTTPLPPYQYDVNSIWYAEEHLYVAGDAGVYKSKFGDTAVVEQQPITPIRYSNAIRGYGSGNHIAVVYDDGIVWHYNGASWKQIRTLSFDRVLRAVAIYNNTIVIGGVDYTVGKALIHIGQQ